MLRRNRIPIGLAVALTALTILVLAVIPHNNSNVPPPIPSSTPVPTVCGETTTVAQSSIPTATVPSSIPAPEYIYTKDNSGLAANTIRTLATSKDGRWIGYGAPDGLGGGNNAGLGLFDGKTWRFCVKTSHVNAIAIDSDGNPWVGADAQPGSGALMHFDGQRWVDYTTFLPDYRIYALAINDGILYVGTYFGIVQFDGKDWTVPKAIQGNQQLKNLVSQSHIHVITFSHGDMWLGTINQGIIRILTDGTTQQIGSPKLGVMPGLSGDMVRSIIESPSGQVMVGEDGGGVDAYDYPTNTWHAIDVPNKHINGMTYDSSGRLWIVTAVGIHFYDPQSWKGTGNDPAVDRGQWIGVYPFGYIAYSIVIEDSGQWFVGSTHGLGHGYIH